MREIPLKIESFSGHLEKDCIINEQDEILTILQSLAQSKERVALYHDAGNGMILTLILAVEKQGLWVDAAANTDINKQINISNRIICVSAFNRAKVQFAAQRAALVTYENSPAIYLSLPNKMLRLQRREYYRLLSPVSRTLKCVIPNKPEQDFVAPPVAVADISIGGIALVCEQIDTSLEPGQVYEDCRITLPEVGEITVTLAVKNTFEISARNGSIHYRSGCAFIQPNSNTMEVLQRYVALTQQKEAQRRAEMRED